MYSQSSKISTILDVSVYKIIEIINDVEIKSTPAEVNFILIPVDLL